MTDSDTFCSSCGFPLSKREIAAKVEGTLYDYEEKDEGDIPLVLCSECRAAMLEIIAGGMKAAKHRQKEYRKAGRS